MSKRRITILAAAAAGLGTGAFVWPVPDNSMTSAPPARPPFSQETGPAVSTQRAARSAERTGTSMEAAPSLGDGVSTKPSVTRRDRLGPSLPRNVPLPPPSVLPPAPRLRAYHQPYGFGSSTRSAPSSLSTSTVAGVTLDVPMEAVLPAVAAAPAGPDLAKSETALATADTVLRDFVNEVTSPVFGSTAATDEITPSPDPVWQQAVTLSDERFRALFGKEAYLRQSMQAARSLRSIPVLP